MTAIVPTDTIQVAPDSSLAKASGQWIQSPPWDAFWMFSAIWGSILLYTGDSTIGFMRTSIMVLFWSGVFGLYHSWSTTFMVLGSSRMREARAANRNRYLWTPIAITLVAMFVGVLTGATLSFPSSDRYGLEAWPWVVYLALFWVGHFWHFGKQDFGVLSLYRVRAGQLDVRSRQIDQAFSRAMMFVIQPIVYMSVLSSSPAGQAFYSFVPVAPEDVRFVATGAVWLAAFLTLVVVGFEISNGKTSLPKLVYYGIMLVHPVVLYHARSGFSLYYMIAYFWSHWLIAIGLVSRINTGHYRELGFRRSAAILRHFLTISAVCVIVALTTNDYAQFRIFSGGGYKEILASVAAEQGLIVGIFLGLFLTEQLLHYYCDRCLFRMRDPDVRKAIGPLL